MTQSNTSKFKRVMCGLLSTLTMLSGTAVAGTAVTTTASAAEVTTETSAAKSSEVTPATFSWDNATVYFLLTDRFKNGDKSNDNAYGRQNINVGDTRATFHGGDFAGITEKINEGYFDNLGVNAIWLTAPYEQIHGYIQGGSNFYHYSYHGYYVLDYTQTDKAYGTEEEFRTLVDTAHEHGIRIIMDIVMNHAGYCSMYDMNEYDFGGLKTGWESFYQNPSSNAQEYQEYMDYKNQADRWAKWWGPDWIRSDVAGYSKGEGNSSLTECLAGLPDFKTESTATLGIPAILQTKWTKEGTLAQNQAKYGSSGTVTDFITKWLSEWVREYGVDGFRCDTAKHVEKSSWKKLKDACVPALREWKQKNPDKALDDLDFWMTGEHWDHGVVYDDYYTAGGFDSMINFDMTGGGSLDKSKVSGKYNDYANAINTRDGFNALSYISSHDTTLARGDNYYLGSAFLMLPGGVQIYYGDETAREMVPGVNDSYAAGHGLRSDMNWDSYDPELLAHWGKVGNFRKNHIAVGAGANTTLTATNGIAFGRTYSKNVLEDKVAGVIGASANTDVTIDVSAIWSDGTMLENFYDDSVAVVSGGKVTFNSGAHSTILIQEPDGERGRVTVTHIDQDSGKTMKTETLVGLLGDSYTATPLDTLGYKLSKTVGSKTGTFSETEGSVTFYYTFDSSNYAHIEVQYVDSETGAAIAEPDSKVGKIGSSYTTEAKSIKNYEVDVVPSNATGTVKSGTTTVTYKYVYVEPSNLQVHYYNSNSWSAVNLYAYTEVGAVATEYTGKWPGASMTSEGDGWFYCDVPDTESGLVIFNNGGTAQEPGQKQPGYDATGEVWIKSGTVYPTGKVNVKYVSTDGKVLGTDIVKGMADGTTKYSTTEKTFSGYTLSSTPSNASGTFTQNAITVTYTYTPDEPIELLSNNSKVSATSLTLGNTLTITGKASGGTSPYKYAYYYKKSTSSSWTTIGTAYTTDTTATFKPGAAVKYDVKVIVKDNAGATAEKTYTVNVSSALTNNSKVSATSLTLGNTLTITGAASGGTSPYKYWFQYKKSTSSAWTTLGTKYGTDTTATFKPGAAVKYNVKITVKDNAGKTAEKTYTVSVSSPVTNNSKVSVTSLTLGNKLTITGAASGGTSPYKYWFQYKKSTATSWSTLGTKYGTDTKATFKPGAAVKYNVKITVKDNAGKTAEKTYTVSVSSPVTNNSKVSSTSLTLGNKLTITGAASGGTSPYKYWFQYKKSTATSWSTLGTKYGTDTTATLKPGAAVNYDVKIIVKDNAGQTAEKIYSVKVIEPVSTLVNNSKVSSTTPTVGNTLTITGAASGGTSPYKYAFYYKKGTATSWTTIGTEYSTTTATFKPGSAVSYDVKVIVKDNSGQTSTKTFAVNAIKPVEDLVNNSKVSATSLIIGNTLTITGAASGGTSPYKYSFQYKKSTSSAWSTIGKEYDTATTATLKPTAAVNYDVKITVKDNAGKTAVKTYTVKVSAADLANKSTISAASLTLGDTLKINGIAIGGTGSYTYAYYYKKSTSSSWSVLGTEYGTATTASLKPSSATSYDIMIQVRDSSGETATKTFAVQVKSK